MTTGRAGMPCSESLFQLGEHLVRVQRELGRRLDLGNDVVVVGVEPLGHLQRRDIFVAARRGEVAVQVVGDLRGPGRQRAEHDRGVEHLVVVGEGVHRHRVQAGGGQARPGVAAQRGGDGLQLRSAGASGPVALGGALEFAFRADARGAGNGCGEWLRGHDCSSFNRRGGHRRRTRSRSGMRCAPAAPAGTNRNGCGQTPIPRGDEPPDAARPAQLAGLRTRRRAPGGAPSGRRFPVSVLLRPVLLTAVVPAYRCGTVPDSHRVPSYEACLTCFARCRRRVAASADQLRVVQITSARQRSPRWGRHRC